MAPSTGYAVAFTNVLMLTIPGTVHGLGTADLLYQLYDTTDAAIEPSSVSVDAITFTVLITFAAAQSGRVLLLPVSMSPSVVTPPSTPPASIPSGTGGMDPALRAMLTETVSHRAYLGQSGYGQPTYSAATLRACRVEFKVAPLVTATGEERTSNTRIFFDTDFTLHLRDKIVMEDGTAPQIQAIYRPRDEFGNVHHQEALF